MLHVAVIELRATVPYKQIRLNW